MRINNENNDALHSTNQESCESYKTIELNDACELLVLPIQVVKALCKSKLIKAEMQVSPAMLSLGDVIALSSVINRYREYHREVIFNVHDDQVWEALESDQKSSDKFKMN